MLSYKEYKPNLLLQNYIKHFYFLEGENYTTAFQRITTDGSIDLKFNLGAPIIKKKSSGLTYQTDNFMVTNRATDYYFVRLNGYIRLVGVIFYPWALGAVSKIRAGEFVDDMICNEDLLGTEIKLLQEQLLCLKSHDEIVDVLQKFFIKRCLKQNNNEDKLVSAIGHFILKSLGKTHLNELLSGYAISSRRIQQRFQETLGISPKLFSKMVRFQNAVNCMTSGRKETLVRIGYECGYYDQAHFIRDFKQFAGITPLTYINEDHPVNDINIKSLFSQI